MSETITDGYRNVETIQASIPGGPDRTSHSIFHDQIEYYDRFGDPGISSGFGREFGGSDFPNREHGLAHASGRVAGDHLRPCGREYVNTRFGVNDTGVSYPTRRLRTVAQAETTTHGAYHPGCFLDGMVGIMATITFTGSGDRTLENRFAPVAISAPVGSLDLRKAGSYTLGTTVSCAGYAPSEVKGSSASDHSATGHSGGESSTDKEQGSTGLFTVSPDSAFPDKTIPTRHGSVPNAAESREGALRSGSRVLKSGDPGWDAARRAP